MYDPKVFNCVLDAMEFPGETDADSENGEMVLKLWHHYLASGYLSARILDYLTPETVGLVDKTVVLEMMSTFPPKPFTIVTIHDCFRCLPNYGNELRKQYNLQLKLIAQSNLLQYMITQLLGRPVKIGKLHPSLHRNVMQTNYALS